MIPYEPTKNLFWPELPYEKFRSTSHLLHMCTQAMGKLKLLTPFEPHWANVALWVTEEGLSTGPIPYQSGTFSIQLNVLIHHVTCHTSWGKSVSFPLHTMSVAKLVENLFAALKSIDINVSINMHPQEIPNAIPFDQDLKEQDYSRELALAWFEILTNTYHIMQRYHAKFAGITPPLGFMWGTFDLRDARYQNIKVPTTGLNAGYIRRNAMDVAQIESGWWSGNDAYPKAAFYSFTYPQPEHIGKAKIIPSIARWDSSLSEFILDYDDLRKSSDSITDLLQFFDSTYKVGAQLAGWPEDLIGKGVPI